MIVDKDNWDVFAGGVLAAELQDHIMELVFKHKLAPTIMITEQDYDSSTNVLTLTMTTYNWKKKAWNKMTRKQAIPMDGEPTESFHNFYWSLDVHGTTLTTGLRYESFERCAEEALGWEDEK